MAGGAGRAVRADNAEYHLAGAGCARSPVATSSLPPRRTSATASTCSSSASRVDAGAADARRRPAAARRGRRAARRGAVGRPLRQLPAERRARRGGPAGRPHAASRSASSRRADHPRRPSASVNFEPIGAGSLALVTDSLRDARARARSSLGRRGAADRAPAIRSCCSPFPTTTNPTGLGAASAAGSAPRSTCGIAR